jgi:hypothetical protein
VVALRCTSKVPDTEGRGSQSSELWDEEEEDAAHREPVRSRSAALCGEKVRRASLGEKGRGNARSEEKPAGHNPSHLAEAL